MAVLTYRPQIFDAADVQRAREIILTREPDLSTDERWARETPYITAMAQAHLMPQAGETIVDYGCGIGRLSKTLIERTACKVIGVDISESMRTMAVEYVSSPNFECLSAERFSEAVANGLRVQGALAVWVIQHVLDPKAAIDLLAASLQPDASLFVVNALARCVPTVEKVWARDGYDVMTLLQARLDETSAGALDPKWVGQQTSGSAFWGLYRGT